MSVHPIYDQLNGQNERSYPNASIHELIEKQAQASPEKVAVLAGELTQTYAELNHQSDQVATYLRSIGIGRGDLVGLCCNRDINLPSMLVGIMKAGAGYVPLDPDYPVDRLTFMVENSEVKHILAHQSQAPIIKHFPTPTTLVDLDWESIATAKADSSPVVCDPKQDVAYVIYTSGSTGQPKGVLVQHSAAVNLLWSMMERPGFTADDRILATTTLSFDISVAEMFLPLVAGGSVAIIPRDVAKDTVALVEAIEKYEVTFMQATPAMWRMILEGQFVGRPEMKFVTAGEPLPRDLIDPMLQRCGELWNLYGPTETTVYSSGIRITNSVDRILIGTPIANTEIFVVDENGHLCPPEVPGELLIAGDGVTLGYFNRDDLNAEKFIQFAGKRAYRTGDLAQITSEGQIDHLGRIDNQIKLHGHRIELGEIDAAMAMQPNVRRAATVLREDQPGDQRLVGYLIASDAQRPDTAKVRASISETLPAYMVPSTIVLVDTFPHTPSGKLDRQAFPPPSNARPDIGSEFVAPKTKLEKQIAKVWCEVLQFDRVGTRDNFFELGGNSIRATKVVALIKQQIGAKISVAEFFDKPTIEGLLAHTESKSQIADQRSASHSPRQSSGEYAIVGMAARFPGAANVSEFWANLVEGRESIRFFTAEELDPTLSPSETSDPNYVLARGILENADQFDARFFNITPRNAELIDPQQRILMELAWTALEDAGIIPGKTQNSIGIWAGTYSTHYFTKNLLANEEVVQQTGEFQLGVYNEKDYIASRVAHALNLTGPAINVNTACSTSLVAVIEACKSLEAGHCDVALAGGASVYFPQNSGHLHQEGSIFSPDGHCRPFDAEGAGTLFSDGAGIVVVKRLEDALESGDQIYAIVKGFGINNDGREKASFSAPSIQGQAAAISMAHSHGDVSADSIGYVEAHGTATPIGDPIEIAALQSVFEKRTSNKKQFCAIGSVKSNIGHTVAAAGVAGLIKTALSLHYEKIPPTLHFQKPNPQIDFANSPFFVCDSLRPWERSNHPRRAGVSSFGVGGTNAHLLLEEAPAQVNEANGNSQNWENELPLSIVPISGKTEQALIANVDTLADHLHAKVADTPSLESSRSELMAVAHSLQTGRDEFSFRAAVVAENLDDATEMLASKRSPQFMKRKSGSSARDVVFMFPGQGSQYVRMGQNLYENSHVFRANLDRCAEILKPLLDRDLRDVLFPANSDEDAAAEILKNTRFTQPALFALGYSMAQLWLNWGIQPSAMIGHSIGEFAAACVAGVFSLEDGLRIISERGRAMQALPGGSMMSVRLPGEELQPHISNPLAIAAFNGPSLCVVAGPDDQIATLKSQLESKDIVCRQLHTSHAFHSPMMDEIVQPFAQFIGQFDLAPPKIPIVSTVTGDWLTDEQAMSAQYWAEHLRRPVKFSDAVKRIWSEHESDGDPSRILVELGPRRTLAALSMQHATDRKQQLAIPTLGDSSENHAEWRNLLTAVSQLWLTGIEIQWDRLTGDGLPRSRRKVSLPTYAFQRKRFFIEPSAEESHQSVAIENLKEHPEPQVAAADIKHSAELAVPIPEPQTMSRTSNIVQAIERVFEDTSGFELDEFDKETTFFEMGLDSLVLTQTATALKKEMGIEITFRQLLENTPTVESLADWLDKNLPADRYRATVESTAHETSEAASNIPTDADTANQVQPNPPTSSSQPVTSLESSFAQQNSNHLAAATHFSLDAQTDSSTHAIVQYQLQLMAAQLDLLRGTPTQPVVSNLAPTRPEPTSQEVQAAVSQIPTMPVSPQAATAKTSQSSDEVDFQNEKKSKRFDTVKLNDGDLDDQQQAALDEIIKMNNAMMPNSKSFAQQHRQYLADPRTVAGFRPNLKEMTHPIVVDKSKGALLWDIDGNEYLDFTCGFGSNLLGHTHEITVTAITEQVQKDYAIGPQTPLAGEVAKLFCELTGNERMAFSNTGSEAVLGCTRLARNATGRDLIVMFNGDYHGILDEVLVRGNSKQKSFPASPGIPKNHVGNTLVLEYGADESLQIIKENIDQLAGILVEPVQSRTPELQPKSFLQELRKMTEKEPTALIFDEVISGLRIGLGGAQEYFGVRADLASYGKIVGGGMPIGIVAGKAQYMDGLDGGYWEFGNDSRPEAGMTYFAGTFVRHPLTLAASKAILQHLKLGGQPMYDRLNGLADYLAKELNQVFEQFGAPLFLAHFGSLFKIQFHQELVYSEVFFAGLRRRGMHIWDHRPCLLTLAHEKEHVDQLVGAVRETIIECQRYGFMPGEGFKKSGSGTKSEQAPVSGAREGKDEAGNPGWFLSDPANPGQFIQVGLPS